MPKKVVATATLVAVCLAPALIAADGPMLVPVVTCASPLAPVKVAGGVPDSAVSAKVYFKAADHQYEYYVDMRRAGDGTMWAYIPAPEPATKSFTYRVVYTDARGMPVSSPLMTATTASSCAPQTMTADEERASMNMVVGLTAAAQSVIPAGFQCRGDVSYISASGEMRPNDECRRIAALGSQPATTTANASTAITTGSVGLRTGTIVALTAVGLSAAGVAIYRHEHEKKVSESRP